MHHTVDDVLMNGSIGPVANVGVTRKPVVVAEIKQFTGVGIRIPKKHPEAVANGIALIPVVVPQDLALAGRTGELAGAETVAPDRVMFVEGRTNRDQAFDVFEPGRALLCGVNQAAVSNNCAFAMGNHVDVGAGGGESGAWKLFHGPAGEVGGPLQDTAEAIINRAANVIALGIH